MCLAPVPLQNGVLVGCRKCWQCIARAVDDWVGRCIAESKVSAKTEVVTLTYGRDAWGSADHPAAAFLTYSDVQGYFKRLRAAGYPLRYFVVGEYGEEKGRAHWHAVVFWRDKTPFHPVRKNFDDPFWELGFSFWDDMDALVPGDNMNVYKAIRYAGKYLQKDRGQDGAQSRCNMSKKPPLGAAWFERLGREHAKQGLAPRDLQYSFPEVCKSNGEPRKFFLRGKSAEIYLGAFVDEWGRRYGKRHLPNSEVVEAYLDGLVPEDLTLRFEAHARPSSPFVDSWGKPLEQNLDAGGRTIPAGEVRFNQATNCYEWTEVQSGGGPDIKWSWRKQKDGAWKWQIVLIGGRRVASFAETHMRVGARWYPRDPSDSTRSHIVKVLSR